MEIKKLNEIYEWIIVILLCLIVFSGDTVLFIYRKILLTLIFFINTLFLIIKRKDNTKKISYITLIWSVILVYLYFSIFYTIDKNTTIDLLYFYTIGVSLLFIDYKQSFFQKLIKLMKVSSIIIAISVFIEFIFPSVFLNLFGKILLSPNNILIEIQNNHYSGIMGEKGYAAIAMCIGISAIMYETFFSGKKSKKTNMAYIIIYLLALLLTSKRTLTVIPFLTFFIILLLSKNKNKIKKILKAIILILIFIIALYFFVPSALNVITRFFEDGDNGRTNFIEYAIDMFKGRKIIGYGFGSFNEYIYRKGFRFYGEKWHFFTHNCYMEFLAELGILGFIGIISAILYAFKKSIILLKNKSIENADKRILYFSIAIQILIIVYAVTGNAFYYMSQYILYIISLCIINYLIRKECSKNEK